ncbi:hypothetical protein [Pseudomonas syringae group genomosp. 3]|uniref:hypothetical protein n=1 Tax=Pseudomonas syringae group genomosp. 3 TaxID=251701 RepID=UPI000AF45849|nr:hypothetical protein [Pseudomonas syringae group genomosp. 3]
MDQSADASVTSAFGEATPNRDQSLFDWLVVGQIALHNSATSVRGPSHLGDIDVML